MKSWLKGGIIGVIVYIILTLILWFVGELINHGFLIVLPSVLGLLAIGFDFNATKVDIIKAGIISMISYFIIGALIGLIIGKIKSKKRIKKRK